MESLGLYSVATFNRECVSAVLEENAKLFSKVVAPGYTPNICKGVPTFPYPDQYQVNQFLNFFSRLGYRAIVFNVHCCY